MKQTGQRCVSVARRLWARSLSQRRVSSNRKGFTLTEVVVASAIMMMVFVAMMGSFSYARRSESIAENRLGCLHIARQSLESLRTQAYSTAALNVGTKKTLPGFPRSRGYYDVTEDADKRTKNITVVIEWVELWGMKQSVSLTTSLSESLHK